MYQVDRELGIGESLEGFRDKSVKRDVKRKQTRNFYLMTNFKEKTNVHKKF